MKDQMKTAESIVTTKDLGQIASLILAGIEPRELRHQGGTLVAEFKSDPRTKEVLDAYVLDRLQVSPRAFLALMRDLKGLAINGSQLAGRR